MEFLRKFKLVKLSLKLFENVMFHATYAFTLHMSAALC